MHKGFPLGEWMWHWVGSWDRDERRAAKRGAKHLACSDSSALFSRVEEEVMYI